MFHVYWHNDQCLEGGGTTAWARDRLEKFVKTAANCSAHEYHAALSTWPGMPPRPLAVPNSHLIHIFYNFSSYSGCYFAK